MSLMLDAVDYRIDPAQPLIAGLSARFEPGRVACLIGPSGAGKTTVLSLLGAIATPQAGQILHRGAAVSAGGAAARRAWRTAHVGFVFQTCRLIDVLTVRQHMALVARLRGHAEAEASGVALAGALGLGDKLDALPGALSGGEKQRVALAQALAHRPAIVLADEPTAALDNRNAGAVAQVLRDYAGTHSGIVVAVSHDDALITAADDIVRLEKA
jgi:putative ABC transport system ATP-binding protein